MISRLSRRSASSSSSSAQRVLRVLVVDGYGQDARDVFDAAGVPHASMLYGETLARHAPPHYQIERHVVYPCAAGYVAPTDAELEKFDGAAFTGSSFSAFAEDDDVTRQIDLMRRTFTNALPCFGSCWGLQLAAMALPGGSVVLNPRGREVGVGRKISLTAEGREHAMFAGKKPVFSAWMSHSDEVDALPAGAILTASNEHSHVQAMAVTAHGTESWFVQYHPEYTLAYLAALLRLRKERMVRLGFFHTEGDLETYTAELEALDADPSRTDVKWKYGIDEDLLDDAVKQREMMNWLQHIAQRQEQLLGE